MTTETTRRKFLNLLAVSFGWFLLPARAQVDALQEHKRNGKDKRRRMEEGDYVLPPELADFATLSLVLGRGSDRSVTVSILSTKALEGYFEYGTDAQLPIQKTRPLSIAGGNPVEVIFEALKPDTEYFYRLLSRNTEDVRFSVRREGRFHTQRAIGSTFTFGVQGDSHPERPQMSDPRLYARTLLHAAAGKPDFYLCMGDDFSVAKLKTFDPGSLAQPYLLQRPFLGLVAQSAPLFLLNGNHEQASLFNFNQTDIRHAVAVGAQNARTHYYPTPSPDGFYTGDTSPLPDIGLLRDYYAWHWGDALFVVLDNYWQSPALVDSGFQEVDVGGDKKGHAGHKDRDWWSLTLGDAQYHWFKRTLEQSGAKYKFVFAHHVLGSGRGGVDQCELYEWGGRNKRGEWEFGEKRPGWELPVHQLMVKHGVTIFFQGHDHLFAKQERDGIVYQEAPMPADQGYFAYNQDRYQSGTKLPNSGHLRVTVAPAGVTVDYLRCFLPEDESGQQQTGTVACSYTIKPKENHA